MQTMTREPGSFAPINRGYNDVFRSGRHSLGLVVPLEAYPEGPVPLMSRHVERAQLADDPDQTPRPLHLGFSAAINPLRSYLTALRDIGVNHLAFNLRFNRADIETTIKTLADELLPEFST